MRVSVITEVIEQNQIELFGTEVDLSDTNRQQRGRQTRTKHHAYKDHVYLDRLFLRSNLTWRRAHVTTGLTGRDPNVNVNVLRAFSDKNFTVLICIYGASIKRDTSVYISEKKNVEFRSAFDIRLLVESSGISRQMV